MLLYCTVQPGFEDALETDVLARYPGTERVEALPGWCVFSGITSHELPSPFARAWGRILDRGTAPSFDEPFVLQCWSRREFRPGARERRPILIDVELREKAERENLRETALRPEREPRKTEDRVLDLIRVSPGDWAWGEHFHSADRLPHAGGEFPWPPYEVPSRAYLKCNEAILLSGAVLEKGQRAIELGCAPGGAALALLERELEVIGIDPGEMEPEIASRMTHLRCRAQEVADVPDADWLFSDMNVPPEELLELMHHWIPVMRPRGVFLTLKLTDRAFIHGLKDLVARLRSQWGMPGLRLRQLSQNRREILLYGLTGS